ncbi:MAG: PKD domain-containing protein [Candidatus Diapherotrites archaeon]|nr:PKD domain-containing protein [Candidatus Diapherotrites archaeon]
MVVEKEAQIFMKMKVILVTTLLVMLTAFCFADKQVQLLIEGQEADTQSDAVELRGPGTFTLTGKIKNNLQIEEVKKNIDLVFILDACGSMGDEIDAVKNSIKEIIDKVNEDNPGLLRAGLYVFEGHGDRTGFVSKPGYCGSSDDMGAVHLTDNAQLLKDRLSQVSDGCGREPWAHLTAQVLNDSNFGWRPDAVRVIIAISDEPNDYCNGESACANDGKGDLGGLDSAINAVNNYNGYFFGIYNTNGACPRGAEPAMKYVDSKTSGEAYRYTNASQIPNRIKEAINYVLSNDAFTVTREEGPDWDDLQANFEIGNVAREGGEATFSITLQTPPTYDQREVYFRYRIQVKGNPSLYDDAWLKVIMGSPPVAAINPLTPTIGDVDLHVRMNAVGTTDEDGDLVRFEWDCTSDGTIEFTTTSVNDEVECVYTEKDKTYTVKMTAYDSVGYNDWAELTVQTNPNKPPVVSLQATPHETYINTPLTLTATANDPDGTIVSYVWDFGDGNIMMCADCPTMIHAYSTKQTFYPQVTVTDNDGETATASVEVKMLNRPPNKPIIRASPLSGLPPLNVVFTVTNPENIDPDADPVLLYEWDFGDGTSESRPEAFTQHTYTGYDMFFEARCRAADIEGDWSEWSDPVRISTLQISSMYDFDAKDVNIMQKTEVKAVCTGSASSIDVKILQDNNVLYTTTTPVPCDGTYHEIDYNFQEAGLYVVRASVHNAPSPCINCVAFKYLYVAQPFPELLAPEISPILVLAIGLVIVFIVRKRR